MNPARRVIEKFGGAQPCADAIGVHVTSVHRWTYPVERGGTDGMIPRRRERQLLAAAARLQIALSPLDFLPDAPPVDAGAAEVGAVP
jgi:hypothetical protein